MYKLTSFNWNVLDLLCLISLVWVSIVQTYILQLKPILCTRNPTNVISFNCTNLHPSTETIFDSWIQRIIAVSIVQTYILQLKLTSLLRVGIPRGFNCTNLHPSTETFTLTKSFPVIHSVSIVQTYILQLKLLTASKVTNFTVSIVQTYILQLKRRNIYRILKILIVSIVQTYILQLKRYSGGFVVGTPLGFNCTNLHPSTETIFSF